MMANEPPDALACPGGAPAWKNDLDRPRWRLKWKKQGREPGNTPKNRHKAVFFLAGLGLNDLPSPERNRNKKRNQPRCLDIKHPTGRDGAISRPACAAGRSRAALPLPLLPKAKAAGSSCSLLSKGALGTPSRADKNFHLPDQSKVLIGVPRGRVPPSTSSDTLSRFRPAVWNALEPSALTATLQETGPRRGKNADALCTRDHLSGWSLPIMKSEDIS